VKRLITLGLTLAMTFVGLVGCSLGLPVPPAPLPASSPGGPSNQASGGTAATPTLDSGDLGPVVATRTGTVNGHPVKLTLHRVVRDQALAQVAIELVASENVAIEQALSDGDMTRGDSGSYTADGITLVDPRQSRVYLVAYSSDRTCLCSKLLDVELSSDHPLVVSATFAAPPSGVTSVEVQVPGFGVFTHVPVV
jgi:hypothetical protein